MVTRLRIETSLERHGRRGWRQLLPREHGVWGWLAVPLVASCVAAFGVGSGLQAGFATLAAGLACAAGLGAAQGLARAISGSPGARKPAAVALLLAYLLGGLAVWGAARPGFMVLTLGVGGAAAFGLMAYTRGQLPRRPLFEVVGIAGFVALGSGLAIAASVPPAHQAVTVAVVFTWLVTGLWWIKRQLAAVLSHRQPWQTGWAVAAVAAATSLALGLALGRPWTGLLPLLYGVRALVHPAPRGGKDAKRLGLTELAWGLAIAVAAALL